MKDGLPEYLYHYTSLSSLGLILKNRNIKFNSLRNMDDLEEMRASDLTEYGKYYFVSSWTDKPEEKLSLWNMYTKDMTGVRIKLHTLPFETYTYHLNNGVYDIVSEDNFLPQDFFQPDKYIPVYYPNERFVEKIEYTDDESLIYPKLIHYNHATNQSSVELGIVCKYKRSEWYFQDEVRYKILFLPIKLKDAHNIEMLKNNIINQLSIPFEFVFLKIKEQYFKNIEITKGPKMSYADSELLELLVKNYCPSAKIIESKFKDKIRI